jgi:ketosteroid isomerase-like protein
VPSNTSRGLERSCLRQSTPTSSWTTRRFEARSFRGPSSGSRKSTSGSQSGIEGFEDWSFDIEEVFDAGDQVVTIVRQRGKAKHGGPEVEMRFAQVWTFRDGLIARMEMYADRNEALEAAGLRD